MEWLLSLITVSWQCCSTQLKHHCFFLKSPPETLVGVDVCSLPLSQQHLYLISLGSALIFPTFLARQFFVVGSWPVHCRRFSTLPQSWLSKMSANATICSPGAKITPVEIHGLIQYCVHYQLSKYRLLWIGYSHLIGHCQNSPLRVNFGVVREFTRFSISRWISFVSPVSYKWRTWQKVKKENQTPLNKFPPESKMKD